MDFHKNTMEISNPKSFDCSIFLNENKYSVQFIEMINKKIDNKSPLVTKKFILISWDVSRPGTWFSIEEYFGRSQLHTRHRTMHSKDTYEKKKVTREFNDRFLELVQSYDTMPLIDYLN
jgi:hypothetical protein